MNCRDCERLLSKRLDSPLKTLESDRLAAHLASCADCRRREQEFAALQTDLTRIEAGSPAPNLAARAVAQWQSEQAAQATRRQRTTTRWALAGLATATAVGAVGIVALRNRPASVAIAQAGQGRTDIARAPIAPRRAKETYRIAPGPEAATKLSPPVVVRFTTRIIPQNVVTAPPIAPENAKPVQDDLAYVNVEPGAALQRWTRQLPDTTERQAAQLRASNPDGLGDSEFVTVPFPQIAGQGDKPIQAAAQAYQKEIAIVDERLQKRAAIGVKSVSLSVLCQQLSEKTGIELTATANAGDENITLYCGERPVRDIMRQISGLFGFTWLRSGEPGAYKYELKQPLKTQLMEEQLRVKDRDEALLDLDRQMERYRKYLDLTPDEAREKAKTATGDDKAALDMLAGSGWGPIHQYNNLSPDQLDALRNGQPLNFSTNAGEGQSGLSPDMAQVVGQSFGGIRFHRDGTGATTMILPNNASGVIHSSISNGMGGIDSRRASDGPAGENDGPLSGFGDAQLGVNLQMDGSEAGQMALKGTSSFNLPSLAGSGFSQWPGNGTDAVAVGMSPSVRNPNNRLLNAALTRDPALRHLVTLEPKPSVTLEKGGKRATVGDILEAVHNTTGMDVIGDAYTRFYLPDAVTVRETPLFDALSSVADTTRERWSREAGWLNFRSVGFYNDRIKEVPTRLLERWAASHRSHGGCTLAEIMEMAHLTDTQLNAETIAGAIRVRYGLEEWEWARSGLRAHLRFLSRLPESLRRKATGKDGLLFEELPLAEQRAYVTLTFAEEADKLKPGLTDLFGSTVRVAYALPDARTDVPPPDEAAKRLSILEDGQTPTFIYEYGGKITGRYVKKVGPTGMSVNGGK